MTSEKALLGSVYAKPPVALDVDAKAPSTDPLDRLVGRREQMKEQIASLTAAIEDHRVMNPAPAKAPPGVSAMVRPATALGFTLTGAGGRGSRRPLSSKSGHKIRTFHSPVTFSWEGSYSSTNSRAFVSPASHALYAATRKAHRSGYKGYGEFTREKDMTQEKLLLRPNLRVGAKPL
jgi:hypothetical protein